MPTPILDQRVAAEAVRAVEECIKDGFSIDGKPSAKAEAARRLGINAGTLRNRVEAEARQYGIKIGAPPVAPASQEDHSTALRKLLRKAPHSLGGIAEALKITQGRALDLCLELKAGGVNLHQLGERYSIEQDLVPAFTGGDRMQYVSTKDNRFKFGVVADSHLGSKYERMDVLNDLYDRFAAEGITHVFHAGNWIEGEARFNRTDVHVHGM